MTVVVSGGRAVPLGDRKAWPLAGLEAGRALTGSRSIDLVGLDLTVTYATIYGSQPWVYSIVNKSSRGIARLPLAAQREDPTTYARAPLPRSHPLPALLSRPYPRGSRFSLIEATVGSLMVFGHALWWKYRPRAGMPPVELWPLPWQNVTIETGDNVPIEHYVYSAPRGRKRILPDDVVHFTWWSPNGLRGTSPLEPLRSTLALDDAQRRYSVASFANGIRPSGALVSDRPLGPDAKKELRAEMELVHSSPDNAFRMMLLDGGLDWRQFAMSAVDAQTVEHRKLNQIEVCAVYDMPPPMVQILDHATFSNIDEQHRMLYQDTFGPTIGNLEETIAAQLLWGEPTLAAAVDPEDDELENTSVAFDMGEVLRADIVKRAASYAAMRAAGGLTANDIRRAEGKPPIRHAAADAVLIPLNMEVVGDDGASSELGLAPRSDPGTAALLDLANALKEQGDTTADDVRELAAAVASLGDRDTAASIDALAKAIADREPLTVNMPAPELKLEPGAISVDVAPAPAPDVEVTVPAPRRKQILTPVRNDRGVAERWEVEEIDA